MANFIGGITNLAYDGPLEHLVFLSDDTKNRTLVNREAPGLFSYTVHSCKNLCTFLYLMRFVEEHTEVGEYNPELLPPVAVLEFSQKVSRELILKLRE